MSRRTPGKFATVTLALGLALGISCDRGGRPGAAPDRVPAAGAAPAAGPSGASTGEGALSIISWAGYMERGETDKNYDWVTGFERDTGCKVTVKTAATSDEMV